MAVRTYIPGLKFAANRLKKFIERYREKLSASLGTEGYALLLVVLDAVIELIAFIESVESDPIH